METLRVHSFHEVAMRPAESHGGQGTVLARRVIGAAAGSAIRHVDLVVLKPGATIGLHRHAGDNEEMYVLAAGHGRLLQEDGSVAVQVGDVMPNAPNEAHGFVNDGRHDVWLVVIEFSHAPVGPSEAAVV